MVDPMFKIVLISRTFLTAVTPTAVAPTAVTFGYFRKIHFVLAISVFFKHSGTLGKYSFIKMYQNLPEFTLIYHIKQKLP